MNRKDICFSHLRLALHVNMGKMNRDDTEIMARYALKDLNIAHNNFHNCSSRSLKYA